MNRDCWNWWYRGGVVLCEERKTVGTEGGCRSEFKNTCVVLSLLERERVYFLASSVVMV